MTMASIYLFLDLLLFFQKNGSGKSDGHRPHCLGHAIRPLEEHESGVGHDALTGERVSD